MSDSCVLCQHPWAPKPGWPGKLLNLGHNLEMLVMVLELLSGCVAIHGFDGYLPADLTSEPILHGITSGWFNGGSWSCAHVCAFSCSPKKKGPTQCKPMPMTRILVSVPAKFIKVSWGHDYVNWIHSNIKQHLALTQPMCSWASFCTHVWQWPYRL
jgi:hypothetical protein